MDRPETISQTGSSRNSMGRRRNGRLSATPHPNGLSDVTADELQVFWADSWPNSAVVYCVHSENPPEPHQRRTAAGLDARWIEMDAGHYPMLTHGEELAGHLAG